MSFPLLDLPDDILADILQRCPPRFIAGFPLPLAMAQVRATGSVDPNWFHPLFQLAARRPAVLKWLSRRLRSLCVPGPFESMMNDPLPCDLGPYSCRMTSAMEPLLSHLTRLESLDVGGRPPISLVAFLPISLTKLSVSVADGFYSTGNSPQILSASLLRLTALEELDLDCLPIEQIQATGGSLPRLRRLKCMGQIPHDLGRFAPVLEELAARPKPEDLPRLPTSLTKLSMCNEEQVPLLPLTRLTALQDLDLYTGFRIAELPDLLEALTALTRLDMTFDGSSDGELGQPGGISLVLLSEALERAPEGLNVCIGRKFLGDGTPFSSLHKLSEDLVEAKTMRLRDFSSCPWSSFTRLTRLELDAKCCEDLSWIQPLSQLPHLTDLDLRLPCGVPSGLCALTQCTRLGLCGDDHDFDVPSTEHLSCLQLLTRLQECELMCFRPLTDCVAALPDCLTKLEISISSRENGLCGALRHLTALEDLEIWSERNMSGIELPPLQRLTFLGLGGAGFFRLDPESMLCLRGLRIIMSRADCYWLNNRFIRHLADLPSLRELRVHNDKYGSFCESGLVGASLVPLTRLSLLEKLVLPMNAGIERDGFERLPHIFWVDRRNVHWHRI